MARRKKSYTRAQKAAKKRHKRFKAVAKKTGRRVQTFGGTRRNYSKKDLSAIDKANFSRSTYTGGAVKDKPKVRKIEPTQFDSRGQNVSAFGSPLNAIKTLANLVPGVNMQLATDAQIRASQQDKPTLTRPKSRGGTTRVQQLAESMFIQPEMAPQFQQPTYQTGSNTGTDDQNLTRIQSQAYNTQLMNSLSGIYGQGTGGAIAQSSSATPAPTAGTPRGQRRVRLFGVPKTRRTGDQFSRAGERIAKLTNLNI